MDDELNLETNWDRDPILCDCLATVVIYDPAQQKHLIGTSIARKFMTLQGTLTPGTTACTVLGGKVLGGLYGHRVLVRNFSVGVGGGRFGWRDCQNKGYTASSVRVTMQRTLMLRNLRTSD